MEMWKIPDEMYDDLLSGVSCLSILILIRPTTRYSTVITEETLCLWEQLRGSGALPYECTEGAHGGSDLPGRKVRLMGQPRRRRRRGTADHFECRLQAVLPCNIRKQLMSFNWDCSAKCKTGMHLCIVFGTCTLQYSPLHFFNVPKP